jgi:hypothetical protein
VAENAARVSRIARFTLESAFNLPDIAQDAPLRQSIAIRCVVMIK